MRLRRLIVPLGVALVTLAAPRGAAAQEPRFARLPADVFDVVPPSTRVHGMPGVMSVSPRACLTLPTGDTRRRIVDVAVQEWGFFGFRLAAASDTEEGDAAERGTAGAASTILDGRRGRRSRLPPAEAARVAASIAGYWAVTSEGPWIVERQNDRWNGADGITARWNAPWSAAFVSWVMCEGGLGTSAQFQRAIAHHAYIDQAIRARDDHAPQAAFVAYDLGETAIAPGDLLCSSRRPAYRTIAERRRQMGVGARSHCDIVVKVDQSGGRVLAIGGNVRGVVSLKAFPAVASFGTPLRLSVGGGDRPMFVHLKLRAGPIGADAFDTSPAVVAAGCRIGSATPANQAAGPLPAGVPAARC